ncbi:hypothetical protein L7F22_024052 [Adiantum nelumboides]|nr:hypothetical protein [Adiantum nelumboides]
MGDAMKADGAFIGQDASVTPLIGKLRLHIQGYVDKEDFFISPLKHEDVILGAPWFDRLAASIKFLEKRISFKFREKNMYIDAQESSNTIPLVHTHAFHKSIKSSISMYMIFVKDSLSDVNTTQVNESGSQEDLELSKFLNQFQDVFIDDIPGELPPKRGDDDHTIELIPGCSPPNKPPYRVSQAQQEEIMRQVNELVEKEMVRPSSSPFYSPVLLVHKKDGTYRMCVDYRALNKITIKNRFLVPRIEDLFDKLQGSTYSNRIDLKSGYHQIRIVNEDILKTAFCTTFGLYEYLVMPFGLTNAPATFNCMMERIFRSHCNFIGVFFDDVIIDSKSMEEHKKHLQVYGEVSKDVDFVASGASSIKSEPSTKKDALPMPTTEQLIEEITKWMQQQMRNPAPREPQMRKCDICGGDHPTPWCTQQTKAPVVNGRVLRWCAIEQKWTNHGIDEHFYNKNYVRERPYGPLAGPPQSPPPRYQVGPNANAVAGADRPQPVLGHQPPLPHENRAMIRYAQPYEAPQPMNNAPMIIYYEEPNESYITKPEQPMYAKEPYQSWGVNEGMAPQSYVAQPSRDQYLVDEKTLMFIANNNYKPRGYLNRERQPMDHLFQISHQTMLQLWKSRPLGKKLSA